MKSEVLELFCRELDAEAFYYNNHDDLKIGWDMEFFQGMDGEEENDETGDDLGYAHPYPGLWVVRDMLLAAWALGRRHDECKNNLFLHVENNPNSQA